MSANNFMRMSRVMKFNFSVILSLSLLLMAAGCKNNNEVKVDPILEAQKKREAQARSFIRTMTDKIIDSSNAPVNLTFEEVAILDEIVRAKDVIGAKRFLDTTRMDVGVLAAQARFNEILQPEKLIFVRYSWDGKQVCYICLDYDNTLVDDGLGKSDMVIPWYTK